MKRLALVSLAMLLGAAGVDGSKRPRPPTWADLATVWVGDNGGLYYHRLELSEDGTGTLVRHWAADDSVHAYRITHSRLAQYRLNFRVEPLDPDAQPIYLGGTALPMTLHLTLGGAGDDWKDELILRPLSRLQAQLDAVERRALALKKEASD